MSSFSQCQGTTTKNEQCRVNWGLDASGLCEHHRPADPQAQAAPASQAQRCRGIRKNGDPCKIAWELNEHHYCKYHAHQYTGSGNAPAEGSGDAAAPRAVATPVAPASPGPQCRGTTIEGVRCQITWGLNENGLCTKYHSTQQPRCLGAVASDGSRCNATAQIDRFGFCVDHRGDVSATAALPEPEAEAERDDKDSVSGNTSDEAPSNDGKDDDGELECKPAMTEVRELGVALLFDKVIRKRRGSVGDAAVRWTIENSSGDVVEAGTAEAGVAYLLSTVRTDADRARHRLTVAADDKQESTSSKPQEMNELGSVAEILLPKMGSVTVRVVRVVGAAP